MSIAPVTGIKVPVSFMGKTEATAQDKPKIDPSAKVDEFNKEANELGDALQDTGAAVTKVTGAAAGVAAPIITVKATAGKFLSGLFKSTMKDADGNAVVDFSKTAKELVEETLDDAGKVVSQKLKDGLTEDQLKQVVYKTKNSPFKIGIAIAVGLAAVALVAKNMMDKKKAEAAEAEAEAAEAAAPEVESEAEAVSEAEETPEEE